VISLILKENEEEITMKVKQTYSPEEKARMVLEGLTYPDGIAKYCRSKGIRDTLFYKWKNQLEKNAKMVFAPQAKESAVEVRLRNELSKKDTIISELVAENLALKKKDGI
jgi:transposase-like protein